METLTSLKRTLKKGDYLTMEACSFENSLIGIKRELHECNTVGFSLVTTRNGIARNSYLEWPKANGYKKLDDSRFEFAFLQNNGRVDSFIYKIN